MKKRKFSPSDIVISTVNNNRYEVTGSYKLRMILECEAPWYEITPEIEKVLVKEPKAHKGFPKRIHCKSLGAKYGF